MRAVAVVSLLPALLYQGLCGHFAGGDERTEVCKRPSVCVFLCVHERLKRLSTAFE